MFIGTYVETVDDDIESQPTGISYSISFRSKIAKTFMTHSAMWESLRICMYFVEQTAEARTKLPNAKRDGMHVSRCSSRNSANYQ